MSRHERRLQQVGDRYDGHSDIDERRRIRQHQRLIRERVGATSGRIDAMGRARGDYESSSVQKAPYKKLMGQLYGWMRQLPVIGFNSGQYDLNVVKQFLVPYFLTIAKTDEREERQQEEEEKEENEGDGPFFVIKRNNAFMCLSTDQLKFLDMTNYLAPGFSYAKYLKAYRCEVTKGHFPYEYRDRLEKLDDTVLPPKEAFFSRLKNEGISDEDYVSCQEA